MPERDNRRDAFAWSARPVQNTQQSTDVENNNLKIMRRKSRICALVLVVCIALLIVIGVAITVNVQKFKTGASLATDVAALGADPCPNGDCVPVKVPNLQRRSMRRRRSRRRYRRPSGDYSRPSAALHFGNSRDYFQESSYTPTRTSQDWSIAVHDKPRKAKSEATFVKKDQLLKSSDSARVGGAELGRDSAFGFSNLVRLNRRSDLQSDTALVGGSDEALDGIAANRDDGHLRLSRRKERSFMGRRLPSFIVTGVSRRRRHS